MTITQDMPELVAPLVRIRLEAGLELSKAMIDRASTSNEFTARDLSGWRLNDGLDAEIQWIIIVNDHETEATYDYRSLEENGVYQQTEEPEDMDLFFSEWLKAGRPLDASQRKTITSQDRFIAQDLGMYAVEGKEEDIQWIWIIHDHEENEDGTDYHYGSVVRGGTSTPIENSENLVGVNRTYGDEFTGYVIT